jgi:hypothetical protein
MKQNIINFAWALLGLAFITACVDEQGSEPGNDGAPVATIYQLDANAPLDPDNDLVLRVATNNQTQAVYYANIPKDEYEAKFQQGGEDGIKDFITKSGTKVEGLSGASTADITIEGMQADYKIAIVATGAGKSMLKVIDFAGLAWVDVATGSYTFALLTFNKEKTVQNVVLQKCTNREGLYRLNKVYGGKLSIKFNLLSTKKDDYQFVSVPVQMTVRNGIYIRDLATKENNQDIAIDENRGCKLYDNNKVTLVMQYYSSKKSFGDVSETFVPNP